MDENRKSFDFPNYLSNAFCFHITPSCVLHYLGKTVKIWQEFLKFELHLTVELHYFFHFISCKLQKYGMQKRNKYQHRGHINHKPKLKIEIFIQKYYLLC